MTTNLLRSWLLISTGAVFVVFASWATIAPHRLAKLLGYELNTKNASSEFHAIYIGVFSAQAALCWLAASRIRDVALGDLCALFLLMQPVGRIVALLRGDPPTGTLRFLSLAELAGGVTILLLRPT